ncbi:MAG TPA: G/U mismatch-specific DNA glycosylase [Armatimonadota bacterium]|nr:G/U mismatch-specific DNA glycosylase [Armatimonadota bacterium]
MRTPTPDEIRQAVNTTVPDVIASGLQVLFCGINPGLYTAAVGHHFARPGNRFWPAMARAGLTPRRFSPDDERELLALGYGITNVAARATAAAADLADAELIAGKALLAEKVLRYQPRVLAVLGVTAYRTAFDRPHAVLGPQPERIGDTTIWVLPNPSGLNAHCQVPELAEWLRRVKEAAEA